MSRYYWPVWVRGGGGGGGGEGEAVSRKRGVA